MGDNIIKIMIMQKIIDNYGLVQPKLGLYEQSKLQTLTIGQNLALIPKLPRFIYIALLVFNTKLTHLAQKLKNFRLDGTYGAK